MPKSPPGIPEASENSACLKYRGFQRPSQGGRPGSEALSRIMPLKPAPRQVFGLLTALYPIIRQMGPSHVDLDAVPTLSGINVAHRTFATKPTKEKSAGQLFASSEVFHGHLCHLIILCGETNPALLTRLKEGYVKTTSGHSVIGEG